MVSCEQNDGMPKYDYKVPYQVDNLNGMQSKPIENCEIIKSEEIENGITAIKSSEELNEYLTLDSDIHQSHCYINHENIEESTCFLDGIKSKYNVDFFETNIVLFYCRTEGCCNFTNWVDSVGIIGNTLKVNVKRFEPSLGLTALGTWFFGIVIKKDDLKNIDDFSLIITTVIPAPSQLFCVIKEEYFYMLEDKTLTKDDFNWINIKDINFHYGESDYKAIELKFDFNFEYDDEICLKVKKLPFVDYYFKGYFNTLYIRIKPEYYDEFNNGEITKQDFNINESFEMKYLDPFYRVYPYFTVYLEKIGTKNAKEAVAHFEKLYFIDSVFYE